MTKHITGSIKLRLLRIFLILAVIQLCVIGVVAYSISRRAITEEAFAKLSAVAEVKHGRIESYFTEKLNDIKILAHQDLIHTLLDQWSGFEKKGLLSQAMLLENETYRQMTQPVVDSLREFQETFGYNDIMVIDSQGTIICTARQAEDLGQKITTGNYQTSPLPELIEKLLSGQCEDGITDFQTHPLSNGQRVGFIGHALDHQQGVVILQIPQTPINEITQDRSGMGDTGETYLVGPDLLLRSQERLESTEAVLATRVDTEGVHDIFQRQPEKHGPDHCQNHLYRNHRDVMVFGHNHFLPQLHWALVTEIEKAEVLAPSRKLGTTLLFVDIILLILSTLTILQVSRRIADPITALSHATSKAANGDLTVDVPTNQSGEIGVLANAFSAMVTGFNMLLNQLKQTANEINTTGNNILQSSEQQTMGVNTQASAVTQTTAAAMELSKTSERIGESIKRVSDMADHVLTGMQSIKGATQDVSEVLQTLHSKSKDIRTITQLIEEVADKTNLLAVNAAIEAARAGEHGRGFSVVADQIGKLADSTARSTKDISSLIEDIEKDMSRIVTAMEQSATSVEQEVQLAQDAAQMANEISTTANEQVIGSRQIAHAMNNIDSSMKQIACGVEQSNQAMQQLNSFSDDIKTCLLGFDITES